MTRNLTIILFRRMPTVNMTLLTLDVNPEYQELPSSDMTMSLLYRARNKLFHLSIFISGGLIIHNYGHPHDKVSNIARYLYESGRIITSYL